MIEQITPKEFEELLSKASCALLDVRELEEVEICSLESKLEKANFLHVPMMQLVPSFEKILQLSENKDCLVCVCRSGQRSQMAAELLREISEAEGRKLPKLINLAGGVLAYSDEVDPSLEKY